MEPLDEDPLDEMDVMEDKVDLDHQEEMAMVEKMAYQAGMAGMEKKVALDEMEEEVLMGTLDLDMLDWPQPQLQQQ